MLKMVEFENLNRSISDTIFLRLQCYCPQTKHLIFIIWAVFQNTVERKYVCEVLRSKLKLLTLLNPIRELRFLNKILDHKRKEIN